MPPHSGSVPTRSGCVSPFPQVRRDRRRPERRDHREPHGAGQAYQGGQGARHHPAAGQDGVQRPGRQRGEQRLRVRHRLHDPDRQHGPQQHRAHADPTPVHVVGDREDPPGRGEGGERADDETGVGVRQRGHRRHRPLQPGEQWEEGQVRVDVAVRQAHLVAVTEFGDAGVPERVPAGRQQRQGALVARRAPHGQGDEAQGAHGGVPEECGGGPSRERRRRARSKIGHALDYRRSREPAGTRSRGGP